MNASTYCGSQKTSKSTKKFRHVKQCCVCIYAVLLVLARMWLASLLQEKMFELK